MTFTPLVTAAEYGGIRITRTSNIVVEVSERVYSIIYSTYINNTVHILHTYVIQTYI